MNLEVALESKKITRKAFILKTSKVACGYVLLPVLISSLVKCSKIDIGALIKGPVYIGPNSIVNPGAKLRENVSIGPMCKIGGELEDVVIQGYTNKQHDGYIGNSYIGEWVNLGANTNNSDLKNNYSNIRVDLGDQIIDAGMFAGCLIGDYTKCGISTMINTGSYIGLGCNLFGSGFQDKHISNFSWGTDGVKTDFNKFINTLEIVKNRRGQEVSSAEVDFLKSLYKNKIKKSN